MISDAGVGSGFFVMLSISNTSVASDLLFVIANEVPARDLITVTLEGSSETSIAALQLGSSYNTDL